MMNELISVGQSVIAGSDVQTVDARELHAFLEVGRDFTNWIKERIEKYSFTEGADYLLAKIGEQVPSGMKWRSVYSITLDMAKELAMVENNDKGRQARRYFIECERIAKGSHRRRQRIQAISGPAAREYRSLLSIAKLSGLKGNQAILAAAQATEKLVGDNPLRLLGALHLVAAAQTRHCTPTELGAQYGESAQAFNKRLENAGFQIKNINGQWQATAKGERHAVLMDTGKRHGDGTPVQQLRWLESIMDALTKPEAA